LQHLQAAEGFAEAADGEHAVAGLQSVAARLGDEGRAPRLAGLLSIAARQDHSGQLRQPVRQKDDHHDEQRADHQVPQEGQVAGKLGAEVIDADRAHHRPDDRAAAAQRRPDDDLGAEDEAGVFRRHHARGVGIKETGNAGDAGKDRCQHDLQPLRIETEIGAARFIVANGDEQLAGIRAGEDQGDESGDDEADAGQSEIARQPERQAGIADQPAARSGPHATRKHQLRDHDRHDQRNHRRIERRRAVAE
jgi:hypothetical protein